MQLNHKTTARVCEQCGKAFTVAYPSFLGRFCTRSCWYGFKRAAVDRICAHCATPFQTLPSYLKKSGGKYCTHACFAAEHTTAISTRFWRYVEKTEGCWEWRGSLTSHGYGQLSNRRLGHPVGAHRVSWEIHFGPIPGGLFVCHRCDNPPCVRPDHLFLGTNDENVADKVAKGRQPRGERTARAKLSDAQVAEIRERWAQGHVMQKQFCAEFGVSPGTISMILAGKTRTHA